MIKAKAEAIVGIKHEEKPKKGKSVEKESDESSENSLS